MPLPVTVASSKKLVLCAAAAAGFLSLDAKKKEYKNYVVADTYYNFAGVNISLRDGASPLTWW